MAIGSVEARELSPGGQPLKYIIRGNGGPRLGRRGPTLKDGPT